MNGVVKAGHIRDKLTQLIIYAETVRALTEMAAPPRPRRRRTASPTPTPLTTNMAKYTFATEYHAAVELGAGLRRRAAGHRPGRRGLGQPRGAAGAGEVSTPPRRPRPSGCAMINMISDLTARDFGGYHAVLAVHAEGSIEAEKMQIFRAYDAGRAIGLARRLAGLD